MSNGRDMITLLILGLIKKTFHKMSQFFPPYRSPRGNVKVGLALSSYATKTDLKNVTHVDVSSFPLKANLASLKTEVNKLDIAKLAPVPDVPKVLKKTEYDNLVTKSR